MEKKITKRQQQAMQTKQKILDISFELASQKGFEALGVLEICEKAGVSTGAFYHYFDSKECLIMEWYHVVDDFFVNEVMPGLLASEQPVEEKLVLFFLELAKTGTDYGPDYIIQLYRAQLTVNNSDFFSKERGVVKGLYQLLQAGQDEHRIRTDFTVEEIADHLLIVQRGIVLNWCQNKGNYDISLKIKSLLRKTLHFYLV